MTPTTTNDADDRTDCAHCRVERGARLESVKSPVRVRFIWVFSMYFDLISIHVSEFPNFRMSFPFLSFPFLCVPVCVSHRARLLGKFHGVILKCRIYISLLLHFARSERVRHKD